MQITGLNPAPTPEVPHLYVQRNNVFAEGSAPRPFDIVACHGLKSCPDTPAPRLPPCLAHAFSRAGPAPEQVSRWWGSRVRFLSSILSLGPRRKGMRAGFLGIDAAKASPGGGDRARLRPQAAHR